MAIENTRAPLGDLDSMNPFYVSVTIIALACVPSLLVWLMFSVLVFDMAKGLAEQALAPMLLIAGWWGWASLVGAMHSTLNDLPWPKWVRLGVALGAVIVVVFLAYTGWTSVSSGDLSNVLIPFMLFGGPGLVLAGTLTARDLMRRGRQGN